jgi:putative polyhydroxyalkanoic acid system protein
MSQPIVVSLPHRLGKAEALRRLQTSFNDAQSMGGAFFTFKNQWSGDHLDFRASILGQTTTGTIDVGDDHVRLEVQLPWLLSMLANKARPWWRSRASSCWRSRSSPPTRR